MNDSRVLSSTDVTIDASLVVAADVLLARILLGAFCIAAVAVLSLPQARGVNVWIGWWPFWLLIAPACSLLALKLRTFAETRCAMPVIRTIARCKLRRIRHRQARRLGRVQAAQHARLASAG